jgi:hypothetical protein
MLPEQLMGTGGAVLLRIPCSSSQKPLSCCVLCAYKMAHELVAGKDNAQVAIGDGLPGNDFCVYR